MDVMKEMELSEICESTREVLREFLEEAYMEDGQVLVVGCSTSEIDSFKIGSHSSEEIGKAVCGVILDELKSRGIYLAAQCCEHLNRALILEEEAARKYGWEPVNVVPQVKACGSFAAAAYRMFAHPVAVEHIRAHGGIDIGDTLIGMHLRDVAVPVRIKTKEIGGARVVCARTRPKFIGGARAAYDESRM